jgi:hypothetical protein
VLLLILIVAVFAGLVRGPLSMHRMCHRACRRLDEMTAVALVTLERVAAMGVTMATAAIDARFSNLKHARSLQRLRFATAGEPDRAAAPRRRRKISATPSVLPI